MAEVELSSAEMIRARRLARAGKTAAELGAELGWAVCEDAVVKRLRKILGIKVRMGARKNRRAHAGDETYLR
jgi:hypothetical protein